MKTRNFINELGNKTVVRIKRTKSKGTNTKTNDEITFTGTEIVMSGSTTSISGSFTLRETLELYETLKSYLESIGKIRDSPELPPPTPEPSEEELPPKPVKRKRNKKI